MNQKRMRDVGVTEVIGSTLLLAITVLVIAAFASHLYSIETGEGSPQRVEVSAAARAGDPRIVVTHTGGPTWDPADLRLVVAVDGALWYNGPADAPPSAWGIGDRVQTGALAQPIPGGARVDVTVTSVRHGSTLATIALSIPPTSAPPPGAGPSVALRLNGLNATATIGAPGVLVIEANATHPSGRMSVRGVAANLTGLRGPAAFALRDDGEGADRVAGDGVYTGMFIVPDSVPTGRVPVRATVMDMRGLNASTALNVSIMSTLQVYNQSLVDVTGHRILKYETGSSDSVTVHVKVRMVADPIALPEGGSWSLKRVFFDYDWLKPGDFPPVRLNGGGNATNDWFCYDAIGKVKGFRIENASLNKYDKDRDVLWYYFVMEWERTGTTTVRSETLDTTMAHQYFIARRTDNVTIVREGDWPAKFEDCSL